MIFIRARRFYRGTGVICTIGGYGAINSSIYKGLVGPIYWGKCRGSDRGLYFGTNGGTVRVYDLFRLGINVDPDAGSQFEYLFWSEYAVTRSQSVSDVVPHHRNAFLLQQAIYSQPDR